MPRLACQPITTVAAVLEREGCAYSIADADAIADAIDVASDIIYALSGGRVHGICTTTKRPVRRTICSAFGPTSSYSDVYGVDCIPLADNLISVDVVRIDGVALASSAYGLIDNHLLFRRDGQVWPSYNDLRLDDTEQGTFSITYSFGHTFDWLEIAAGIEVTLQLLAEDARRPGYLRGVSSANVQGASVQINQAAADMATKGMPQTERLLGVFSPRGGYPVGVWAPEMDGGWELVEVEGPSGS